MSFKKEQHFDPEARGEAFKQLRQALRARKTAMYTSNHHKSLWDTADKILRDLSFIAPEDTQMKTTKVVEQLMLATYPLVKIHEVLDGKEWSPDSLEQIATILLEAGFEIEEP